LSPLILAVSSVFHIGSLGDSTAQSVPVDLQFVTVLLERTQ
jgi:hypothetical protein